MGCKCIFHVVAFVAATAATACTTPNQNYRESGGPCEEHRQCESSVCLPNGTCGDAEIVAYVDPKGDGDCRLSSPCSSIEEALATRWANIKLTGTIVVNRTIALTKYRLYFHADKSTKITRDTPGPIFQVDGGSQIAIYDVEFTGAKGADGHGIWMPAGNASSVSLERVTIHDNAGSGIKVDRTGVINISHSTVTANSSGVNANQSTVNIKQSTISNSQMVGIETSGGKVRVEQSAIEHNAQGGLRIEAPTELQIANNFIVRNGGETSQVGGMFVRFDAGSSGGTVNFNTIADNGVQQAQPTGGVMCYGKVQTSANLILRNAQAGVSTQAPQTYGDCGFSVTSLPDPAFRSAADYHLTSLTPLDSVRDAYNCAGGSDFDGDARPQGGKCDLGADEYKAP